MKISSNLYYTITLQRIVLNAVFFMIAFASNAQDLPKVIPPSPEASALFRFQDYPMDYSTGLPSITIPLYELKCGSLSVPITLGYHASGRRVTDQDGPVALGWSLDAGGIISRTVYGSTDFGTPTNGTYKFPYPFRTTGLTNFDDYRYFEKITHFNNPDAFILPWTDSEYDIFSYNFGGNGGKFLFTDNNNVKTAVLLPYKPYIVTPFYTNQGLGEIDITDDKGVFYKFAQAESAGPDGDYPVTSLSISQMISADKADTINFIYTGFAQWVANYDQTRTYKFDWTLGGGPGQNGDLETTESPSTGTYQIKRLTEINCRQGKVLFNLASGTDKIDNIQIKDYNNNLIKTIQVKRSIVDRLKIGGSTLNPNISQINNKLDTLIFKDNIGNGIEKYAFEYYPTIFYGSEMTLDQHYIDWWGFYNASGFTNMIPDYYLSGKNVVGIDHVGGTDWNREPNLEAMKSGVLKKITYPTGGSSIFSYENNMYANEANTQKNGPGLRVAQIISNDNNGGSTIKTYKYGIAESGNGFLELKPDVTTMAEELDYREWGGAGASPGLGYQYNGCTFHSGFNSSLSAMGGRPVIYTQVSEYIGTPDNNIGKTIYEYDNYAWAPAGMPAYGPQIIIKKHIYNFNYWNNPSLLFKTDYKNTSLPGSAPAYTMRKKLSNVYTLNNISDVAGLHVQRLQTWPQTGIVGNNASYYVEQYAAIVPECLPTCTPEIIFTFSDYHIPVGVKTLASSSETMYNDDGSVVTTTTNNTYNSKYYLSQTVRNASDGGTLTQSITYPFDYTGNLVLSQMIAPPLNMISFPVEQSEYKNATPVKSTRTNYYNWGAINPMFKPQTIDVKKGTNAYETRLRFFSYDASGNPTSFSKENDMVNSYIWDYKNTYPIAEVKNAGQVDIAYTSFEADGKGNWTFTGSPSTDATAITGSKVYDPASGAISKTLGSSSAYVVSYWSKNGAKNISGTTAVAGRTINGWTYYENTGSFYPGYNLVINDAGVIDDLRLYPANAQMVSYTYKPLVGQISAADPNGAITYYEYDEYGRLKLIRDLNGKILKTFKYQYQSVTP